MVVIDVNASMRQQKLHAFACNIIVVVVVIITRWNDDNILDE